MPLIKVKRLNWEANFAYAPPQEDAVINTDDIQQVFPVESRGSGPFVTVKFRDGSKCTCVGEPADFVKQEGE